MAASWLRRQETTNTAPSVIRGKVVTGVRGQLRKTGNPKQILY
jgi:hypothetical protein